MGLLSEPDSIVVVSLPFDEGKPEDKRVKWNVRVLSSLKEAEYDAAYSAAGELQGLEREAALDALILAITTGWDAVDESGASLPLDTGSLKLLNRRVKSAIASQLPVASGWEEAYATKKG